MRSIARALVVIGTTAGLLGTGCGDESQRASASAARPAADAAGPIARPAATPPRRPGRPEEGLPDAALAMGRFLVATRQLDGPFFSQTVVLLLDYSATGALGVIVNRPTRIGLRELLPALSVLSDRDDRVFMGGPVDTGLMVFLIRSASRPPASQPVLGDIHATGSAEALRSVVEGAAPTSRFHAYVGYAGWGPGQLDAEVARGDWYVVPGDPDRVFDPAMDDLWDRLVFEQEGLQVRAPEPRQHDREPASTT